MKYKKIIWGFEIIKIRKILKDFFITIPKEIEKKYNIYAGMEIGWEIRNNNAYLILKAVNSSQNLITISKVLKSYEKWKIRNLKIYIPKEIQNYFNLREGQTIIWNDENGEIFLQFPKKQ